MQSVSSGIWTRVTVSTSYDYNHYTTSTSIFFFFYYLTHSWEDKGVHTFPKGICPKVNVIARLEYELAYYDSAIIALTITSRGHPPGQDMTQGQFLSGV